MIIGAKIFGSHYGKEKAGKVLETFKDEIEEEVSASVFDDLFLSIDPASTFLRMEISAPSGRISVEYRKYTAVNPAMTGMRGSNSEIVVDVEKSWNVQIELEKINAEFFLDTDMFELGDFLKRAFSGDALYPLSEKKYSLREKMLIGLDVSYLVQANADLVLDGKQESVSREGTVGFHLERVFRVEEEVGIEIFEMMRNVLAGTSKGSFGGMDTEVRNMRDMMEKAEKARFLTATRILMNDPEVAQAVREKEEAFVMELERRGVVVSEMPVEVKMRVEVIKA